MTQVQKLQRRNLILAGIALLLLAFVVLRAPETSAVTEEELPKLLSDLAVDNVRAVQLAQGGDAVELRKTDEGVWVVATAHDYPANATKVDGLLEKLLGVRKRTLVTRRAETFDEYAPTDGWIEVKTLDALGKPLASFAVGKSAQWPDAYVRIDEGGTPVVYRVANLQPSDVRTKLDTWSEARLWPDLSLPDVTRIDVFPREAPAFAFAKKEVEVDPEETEAGEDSEPSEPVKKTIWAQVVPAVEGEQPEADTFAVEGLVRAFTGMRFTDIAGGEELAEKAGLDEPAYRVIVAGTPPGIGRQPPSFVLEIGGKVEADEEGEDASPSAWYVRRKGDPYVFTVASYAVGEFRKAPGDFLPAPEEEEAPAEPQDAPGVPSDQAEGSPDGGTAEPEMPGPPPVVPPEQPKEPEQPEQPKEPKDAPPDVPRDE